MSYQFYKILHVLSLVVLSGCLSASLLASNQIKWAKHVVTLSLVVLFVAGFGLLAKMKLGFPLWILIKILIWSSLVFITHFFLKKLTGRENIVFPVLLSLLGVATVLAISKPF